MGMNQRASLHQSVLAAAAAVASFGTCSAIGWSQPQSAPAATPGAQPRVITFDPEYPAPPAEGIYVSDRGVVLSIDQQTGINKAAALVKIKTGLPVMVVTIRSLEVMGADPAKGLDPYATEVFKRWTTDQVGGERAALLLLSRDDLQARIVLGAGWPDQQRLSAQHLADGPVLTALKTGKAGDGILAAVGEVGAMFTAAGFATDAGGVPGGLPPAAASPAGKIATDTPVPAVVPSSGVSLSSIGPLAWIGIGAAFLVVVALAAVLARSSKRTGTPDA